MAKKPVPWVGFGKRSVAIVGLPGTSRIYTLVIEDTHNLYSDKINYHEKKIFLCGKIYFILL